MDIVKGKWGFHWNNWNARGYKRGEIEISSTSVGISLRQQSLAISSLELELHVLPMRISSARIIHHLSTNQMSIPGIKLSDVCLIWG